MTNHMEGPKSAAAMDLLAPTNGAPSVRPYQRDEWRRDLEELDRLAASPFGIDPLSDDVDRIRKLVATARERFAIEDAFSRMTERLHEVVQRHGIGLGGEHVDELVVTALDALMAEIPKWEERIHRAYRAGWIDCADRGLGEAKRFAGENATAFCIPLKRAWDADRNALANLRGRP